MMYLLNGLPAFFGTFNVTGNIIISGQGLFGNGTNAVPSISFQSDPDTGLYLDAANTLGIATAGAGTVLFSSSAGIGKIKAHGTRVLALEAGTGNTNITLTPSGTGKCVVLSNSAILRLEATSDANYRTEFLNSYDSGNPFSISTFGSAWLKLTSNGLLVSLSPAGAQKILIGTLVDSGALLQVGTNTTNVAGGMVFGTDTFLFRSAAGTLDLNNSGGESSLRLLSTGTARFNVQTFGGAIYADALTGSFIFRTNGTTTALTLDSSQNATFAARSSATTAYGTAKSVTVDFTAATLTNVTRTFTVTMPSPNLAGTFLLEVGVYGNGATGSGSLLVKGYGYLGTSTLYDGTEISKVSSGNVTVSSITKGNGSFTFTVLDTANAAYVVVKYSQTSDAAITTLPTITSA